MPDLTTHTHPHTHLLFGRHRIFQHGGLLISLHTKVVFALFLWKNHGNVSKDCSRDLSGSEGPECNPPHSPHLWYTQSSSPPLYCYNDFKSNIHLCSWTSWFHLDGQKHDSQCSLSGNQQLRTASRTAGAAWLLMEPRSSWDAPFAHRRAIRSLALRAHAENR